jgi:hypothetical protein
MASLKGTNKSKRKYPKYNKGLIYKYGDRVGTDGNRMNDTTRRRKVGDLLPLSCPANVGNPSSPFYGKKKVA